MHTVRVWLPGVESFYHIPYITGGALEFYTGGTLCALQPHLFVATFGVFLPFVGTS